jgi:hypothetical protein
MHAPALGSKFSAFACRFRRLFKLRNGSPEAAPSPPYYLMILSLGITLSHTTFFDMFLGVPLLMFLDVDDKVSLLAARARVLPTHPNPVSLLHINSIARGLNPDTRLVRLINSRECLCQCTYGELRVCAGQKTFANEISNK